MNPPPAPPLIRPPANRGWLWVGLALVLFPLVALGVIVLGVASYFHLSSDTRALRNGLMEASGVEWRQQIGLNIGSVTLGVVRAGLSFAPLDSEARAAVQAVRGVEVGIYEPVSGTKPSDCAAMLAVADKVLNARGWERVVGVLNGEELVSVYIPAKTISARRMKCCVMVFDGRQMVVASVRADLEPLLECLRNQTDIRAKVRSLAVR
jgi:hypothetical protein